jgi:hypothetical protein
MGSLLLYTGLFVTLVGASSLWHPLKVIGIPGQAHGTVVLLLGLAAVAIAVVLPSPLQESKGLRTHIDAFVPFWQFGEVHEIRVHASTDHVYRALRAVTAEEIRFFRILTWIRQPRLPWATARESILAPPARQPVLDVALRSGFLLLADEPPREIVVGAVVCCGAGRSLDPQEFARLAHPGYAKAGMNFIATDKGDGWTQLRTETRIYATDDPARRRFGLYWRTIYPGSWLIRFMWLRAIKVRAEAPKPA